MIRRSHKIGAINISGIKAHSELFHNTRINVYPTTVSFEDIHFWIDNYRTILSFDLLVTEQQKELRHVPLPEIIDFISKQQHMRIPQLAESIERNGVRTPLILLQDGTLLDGNRRYFACAYLKQKAERRQSTPPNVLNEIPAWVIKGKDVNQITRYKILAEANFVDDQKVEWPLDVKAKVINDYFRAHGNRGATDDKVYKDILDVFSVKTEIVKAYVDSFDLSDEFINGDKTDKGRLILREIVQKKFVYFWEFRNKFRREEDAGLNASDVRKIKKLFFGMIKNDRFKNIKQVEPMIRAYRDPDDWKLLEASEGTKIDQIEVAFKEERAIRSAEDKIRRFLKWFKKTDQASFTVATLKLIKQLITMCKRIVNG